MEHNTNLLAAPETDIIDRYLTGRSDSAECARVEAWINANPEWGERIDVLGLVLRHTPEVANVGSEKASEWADTILSTKLPDPKKPRRRPVSRYVINGAMGLIAATALFIVGWGNISQWVVPAATSDNAPLTSVYSTGRGERATVTLPDGTTAMLNVDSRIEVPSDYDRGNRKVVLHGEALFSVSHYDGKPFTVLAGPSITQVLGTTFVVRHYDTDSAAVVAVRDGKVSVSSRDGSNSQNAATVLLANQRIDITPKTLSPINVASASQFSFVRGVLALQEVTLAEAVPELNRWYNADIRIGDATLLERRVQGNFVAGSVGDLTEVLEWTLGLHVVRDGRVLTLYQKNR